MGREEIPRLSRAGREDAKGQAEARRKPSGDLLQHDGSVPGSAGFGSAEAAGIASRAPKARSAFARIDPGAFDDQRSDSDERSAGQAGFRSLRGVRRPAPLRDEPADLEQRVGKNL